MNRIFRTATLLALIAGAGAAFAPAASAAAANVTVHLSVQGADRRLDCDTGVQAWRLFTTVVVDNNGQSDLTLTDATFPVEYSPGQTGPQDASFYDDAGLMSLVVPAGQSRSVSPILDITTGCSVDVGTLSVNLTWEGFDTPSSDGPVTWITNQQVPVGTVGLLGLAVALGIGLLLIQRRSSRRRAIVV